VALKCWVSIRSEDSEIERQPQSAAGSVCNLTPVVWKDRWSVGVMAGKVRGGKTGERERESWKDVAQVQQPVEMQRDDSQTF